MSWDAAIQEARRRVSYLPIPAEGRCDGLVVMLLEFQTDEVAGFQVGGNSAEFQRMVNNAMRRILKPRGVRFRLKVIKLGDMMEWVNRKEEIVVDS